MNRCLIAFCLSTSLLAVGFAGLALIDVRTRFSQHLRETLLEEQRASRQLRVQVRSLERRVAELEALSGRLAADELEPGSADSPAREREAVPESDEAGSLREQVEALSRRLATLEDEETIARLAETGEEQVREKEIRTALDRLGSPRADPRTRLEAMQSLRKLGKQRAGLMKRIMGENDLTERDIVLPMLDLARDPRLDPDFRAEVVENLAGSKVEELRQPLLELLIFDQAPRVREETIVPLLYHLEDATVREAITRASQQDPHEGVRATAQRYLPKVESVARMAEEPESTGASASGGQEK